MTRQMTIGMSAAGLVVAGVLGYFIVHTMNQQSTTQQQLNDLRAQMAAATTPAASIPANTVTPSMLNVPTATPDGSAMAKQKALQDYLAEGFRLLNSRDAKGAEQAAAIFREGIDKIDGNNIYMYNGLGRSLLITGKYADALQAFEDGRKIDPKRAELASGAGWAHWNLKEYVAAKQAWEDAVKLDPNSEDAWMALSWIYLTIGDDEKSKQGFVILLKIDSTRKDWTFGLNMARAGNHSVEQIRTQFKGMPVAESFSPTTPAK